MIKILKIMACSCKSNGSSTKQVTTVKQVTKKPVNNNVLSSTKPQKRTLLKTNIVRRRM